MTLSQKQYQAYSAAMQTMASTRQVVMLYEGIIRFLVQAHAAMQKQHIEARYNNLTRASEIVFGLQSCIDFQKGGEAAKTLYNFYASVDTRIFSLHRSNDAAACDLLIADVRQMRDLWADIDQGSAAPPAESAPAETPPSGTDDEPGVVISA